jgi:gamma-glutamyltranspeptidase
MSVFASLLVTQAEGAGEEFRTRSPVIARHGIVATSQPLAAQAGLEMLKAGGNAVDAAIATNAMLGLVEPASCGIGGDLFAIVWDAKTKKLYGLNASGRSPYAHTRELFKDKGLKEIPITGPLSWSVPGAVSGWEQLRKRFGTKSKQELLWPAIKYAEEGFAVTPVIASEWRGAQKGLSRWPNSARTYLIDGNPPRAGQVFTNPRLAQSYRLIVEGGEDAFYRGPIAQQIVDWSEKNGGLITMKDFADHKADWVEPVSTNYRGYDVWELPPNGQGIAALQMLNLLEQHDVRKMGFGSADHLHLFLEAKKLAFADRARHYFDPDFGKPPVERLISKEYARERGKLIDMKHAAKQVAHGDLEVALRSADTIYLTVVDKDRNCCSLIQSTADPAAIQLADPNRNGVLGHTLGGRIIKPGDPAQSYLLRRLADPQAGPLMPLANCCFWTRPALRALYCWVSGLRADGSNAMDPIDYDACPATPPEPLAMDALDYPEPGPGCETAGLCPVQLKQPLPSEPTFANVYEHVFVRRCAGSGCHFDDDPGGLDMSTRELAYRSLVTEERVVPGDPGASVLWERLTRECQQGGDGGESCGRMPLGRDPLPREELDLIEAWIRAGAPGE